ncbi:MAG: copper homeostasis membrane protein CopD [Novosphingobium sp.]
MIDNSLVAARALVYGTLLMAAGLPIYLLTAGLAAGVTKGVRSALAGLALGGVAASIWWALASVAAMAAQPIIALDQPMITAVLEATPLGLILAVRLPALVILILTALLPLDPRIRLPLAALCGSIALATCAFSGHAGATEGSIGAVHRLADVIHLIAAGTWAAALVVLLTTVIKRVSAQQLVRQLSHFATTGTVIVAALMLTGAINTLAILGWPLPPEVYASLWGKVLLIKLGAFAAMLGLAALNRWRLTPALAADDVGAGGRLRRSLVAETGLALGIMALVAALGLLDPAG